MLKKRLSSLEIGRSAREGEGTTRGKAAQGSLLTSSRSIKKK